MNKRVSIFFVMSLVVLSQVTAKNKALFQHFSVENGLSQNSVKFLAKDELGFLWLSTEDGITRFDGCHFKQFSKQNIKISSNHFQAIYTGENGGLYTFNDQLEQVTIKNGVASPMAEEQRWLRQKKKYVPHNVPDRFADGLFYMHQKIKTGMQGIYISTGSDSIYYYDDSVLSLYKKGVLIQKLKMTIKGDWSFFVVNGHLYLLQPGGKVVMAADKLVYNRLKGDIVRKNNKAIATFWNISVKDQLVLYADASFYLAQETKTGELTTKLLYKGFDAVANNICATYYDPVSGNLYLGSSTLGLFILSPRQFTALAAPQREQLFYSQAALNKNTIITPQGVLATVDDSTRSVRTVEQFIPEDFYSILTDKEGYIWTRWQYWLYKYSPIGFKKVQEWKLPDAIHLLCQGRRGITWISLCKGGIYVMEKGKAPRQFITYPGEIGQIIQPDDDLLFFCTNKGLYKVCISTGKIEQVSGLEDKRIRSVKYVSPEEIWVTTEGEGFFLLKKNKLIRFPLDNDNFLSTPHCFMEDNRGFFWVPTNKGLFQMARKDLLDYAKDTGAMLYYHYYNEEDGFNTNEFNGGCEPPYLKLDNGYASLPSMDGLVVFKPDAVKYFLPDNKLLIEEITLDEKPVTNKERIDLPGSFGQLAIRVSSPYMGHFKNLQLYYALEVDEKKSAWIPVPADGIIRLLMLPVGYHKLIIRKLNGFGITNYSEHIIELYVPPPWYRKAWFYALIITIVIAGVMLFSGLRIRFIRRRNKMLEIAINNKTKQLMLQTTIQEKIIHSISHDVRTPLRYFKIIAQRISNNLREKNDFVNLEISGSLENSAGQMEYMIDNLVSFLKTQIIAKGPSIEPLNIHHLVEEKRLLFQIITSENETSITNQITENAIIYSNPHLLGIIIQNVLDNAVKATFNGQITISVVDTGDVEQLVISDQGNGISETLKSWLNQTESLVSKKRPVPIHEVGLGLIIITELADLLAIGLQVSGTPGTGTTFTFTFNKHREPNFVQD